MSHQRHRLKLGVNIDHVATLRQARYATMLESPNAEPNLLDAARVAEKAGADSVTIHLRADRRHIQDADVVVVRDGIGANTALNLEIGNTPEIVDIALRTRPDFVCLVPENREEITTEGGLDVVAHFEALKGTVSRIRECGMEVSMFIDPDLDQVEASRELGAEIIELHTGAFANATDPGEEISRLRKAAEQGHGSGLRVHAGHGLNTLNVRELFVVPHLVELNIGHHLVSRAIFIGFENAVREMIEVMDQYPETTGQ